MSLGLPKIGMKISHFKFKIFKFAFHGEFGYHHSSQISEDITAINT